MTTTRIKLPHPNPCESCPYRRDVPSGVWDAEEYEKLVDYDGEIVDQIINGAGALFMCHQQDGALCAGWVGHRDPADLLALRIAVNKDRVDSAVFEYTTTVPLFASGSEAAVHGQQDIEAPDEAARAVIDKITRRRSG